jgi:hypothetical protein
MTIKKTINDFFLDIQNKKYLLLEAQRENGEKVWDNFTLDFKESSNTLVVYGDNACGKSFICKFMEQVARQDKICVRNACVRNRTAGGTENAMIYGDEGTQSTGQTSFSVLKLCFNSAERDRKDSLVILDEPDIGLSPRFSKALGEYVYNRTNTLESSVFTVIISHNHDFIRHLLKYSDNNISSFGINTDKSLNEWIESDDIASIEELENLPTLGIDNWRAIEKTQKK